MFKALSFTLSIVSLTLFAVQNNQMQQPQSFSEEDEWLITDRDRGSREKPNLYDYNRQNVQYNREFSNRSKNSYSNDRGYDSSSYYDDNAFNKSYIQDNTSPYLYRD